MPPTRSLTRIILAPAGSLPFAPTHRYAGSGEGVIYRFAEQATDLAVQAHPLPDGSTKWSFGHNGQIDPCYKGLCRCTALWFDPKRKVLISSGDDGWLHQWDTTSWGTDPNVKPQHSFDLNAWVVKELKGTILKASATRFRPATPHLSVHASLKDGHGYPCSTAR